MRKFLFRGLDIHKEWHYGDLQQYYDGGPQDRIYRDRIWWFDEESRMYNCAFVAPVSVCQFTGLKDANDNLIFENDIVRIDTQYEVGLVTWKDALAKFVIVPLLKNNAQEVDYSEISICRQDIEVIGTVYERPYCNMLLAHHRASQTSND